MGLATGSTGSLLTDAALGGVIGYALAPVKGKLTFALVGAGLTTVFGMLGAAGLVVYAVLGKK